MAQIFIFGASTAYGVGAESGWGDLLKQSIHDKMYGENGIGEKHEVYNFAKPGATVEFVMDTAVEQIGHYKRNEAIAIVQVGGNNAKATGSPDNFVSTPEEYGQLMSKLIDKLKSSVDTLIVLTITPVDETKTNPKHNPLTGNSSYFKDSRIALFNQELAKICNQHDVNLVDVLMEPKEWVADHLSVDGLHPNQKGYRYISEKVAAEINRLLNI